MNVSVLMATRDRPHLLERSLGAFAALRPSAIPWEMIVVDDGTGEDARRVLARFTDRLPLVTLATRGGEGKSRALNVALPSAKGALLAFVDDDTMPAPDWLEQLVEGAMRWPDRGVFGGRILPRFPGEVPSFLDLEWSRARDALVIGDWGMAEGPCPPGRVWGPNMAVRRDALGAQRFDERRGPSGADYAMGCDTELARRVCAGGPGPVHLPSWTVEHVIREEQLDPRWLRARAFRAGRGDAATEPTPRGLRIAGAPLALYRSLLHNRLLAFVNRKRPRESLKSWMWYELARGQIHQHRLMWRERRGEGSRPAR